MNIREMKLEDVPAIANLEKTCFSDPWSENSIASELNNRLSYWLVADDHGTIAGYIGSQTVLDWSDVMNIAVAPEYRRQGVGEALMNGLMDHLTRVGAKVFSLEVRVSNAPAIALYEKLGFTQAGRRPNYYHHPREDALILRKELG